MAIELVNIVLELESDSSSSILYYVDSFNLAQLFRQLKSKDHG